MPIEGKSEVFTGLRSSLYGVAYHMLGNVADAEDMVQECFLRWEKTDASQVRAPKAFLTTVVTRLCLRHLQSAHVRGSHSDAAGASAEPQAGAPDANAELADALAQAMLVMLKALSPLERTVFLLREVFDCDYLQISEIVEKSEKNCRQILRRAREAVASRRPRYQTIPRHEEQVVRQFVRAATDGNWTELINVLSENATLVCDGADVGQGSAFVQGVEAVAELLRQRAACWVGDGASIQLVWFQNSPGIVASRGGVPVGSVLLLMRGEEIESVRVITCPVRLRSLLAVTAN